MTEESMAALARAQELSADIDAANESGNFQSAFHMTQVYCGILVTVLVNELLGKEAQQHLMAPKGKVN